MNTTKKINMGMKRIGDVIMAEFNQIAYQNNFIKEKYDRINLTVPKGRKEEIKRKAVEQGLSVNEYINRLLEAVEQLDEFERNLLFNRKE